MIRLRIAALCAVLGFIGPVAAAEQGQGASSVQAVPIVTEPVVASAVVPASAPAAPAQAPTAQAPVQAPAAQQAPAAEAPTGPRSGVPPHLRRGGDATKCLDLSSDKEIAACAEKFR